MRNNAERLKYVEDPENWKLIREDIKHPRTRISRLEYGGKRWYKLEIWMTDDEFNYETTRFELVTGWKKLGIYGETDDRESFTRSIRPSSIVEIMKDIDREEKKK